MHGRPVQYLLNGVPLSGSRSLSRELNSIDPEQIERVEVLSGATSIYGAGAAGGLINIVTKSTAGYGLTRQTRLASTAAASLNPTRSAIMWDKASATAASACMVMSM